MRLSRAFLCPCSRWAFFHSSPARRGFFFETANTSCFPRRHLWRLLCCGECLFSTLQPWRCLPPPCRPSAARETHAVAAQRRLTPLLHSLHALLPDLVLAPVQLAIP